MYLRSTAALSRLCDQAKAEGLVALDVEFIREYTFKPQLALIQMAVSDTCVIVDPLAVDDLSPLSALVSSPDVLKLFHAPAQDLEVLYWHTGVNPVHLFDTQIAAAILGLGEQLSYSRLVDTLLGISLTKGETYTNWLQRPLTPQQVAYALDDVRYLQALHRRLTTRLEEMERSAWAVEEFRKFENIEPYQRNPRTLYRRIRRGRSLPTRGQAILRELAAWREHEARERDRPPGSVLRDDVLVDIARKAPQTLQALQQLRGLPPREIDRSGASLLAMVQRGLAVPDADCPQPVQRVRLSRTEDLMVKFLDTYLKVLCQRRQLTPSCIASRTELEQLVRRYRQGRLGTRGSPILEGWRRHLVGLDLLAVLEGRVSLHIHAETGELVSTQRPSAQGKEPPDPVHNLTPVDADTDA
ncbi:Ribonuclease D [Candidatus Entotheonellaceae bacterium PAL068K]